MVASSKSRDRELENVRIEESQVRSYGELIHPSDKAKLEADDNEDLYIRDESGNREGEGRLIYERHIVEEEEREESRYE